MKSLAIGKKFQRELGLIVLGLEPRIDYATGEQSRQQQTNRPRWAIQCAAMGQGGESLSVTVASDREPELSLLGGIHFEGLRCGGSSSGLWFVADEFSQDVDDVAAVQSGFEGSI